MTTVDKLLIQGIRSFDPNNREIIEFYRPLTIIVGQNGAGKTTVIECLKYACTGELPPNSRSGQAFVHDPRVAGEREVKGQIKLRFCNVKGKPFVVTRSMQLTQKAKSQQLKTLDSTLQTYGDNHEKISQSKRCADIDREVPEIMGVSKAIIQNVIFCHQEESNWPLSEGGLLKKKFDDIFAATKYTKALEHIKKFRKEQTNDVKQMKLKLDHLNTLKEQSDGFKKIVENAKADIHEMKLRDEELKKEQETLQASVDNLKSQMGKGHRQRNELSLLKEKQIEVQGRRRKLGKALKENLTDKTDAELKNDLENWAATTEKEEAARDKLIQRQKQMEQKIKEIQKSRDESNLVVGQMKTKVQQAIDSNEKRIRLAQRLLKTLNEEEVDEKEIDDDFCSDLIKKLNAQVKKEIDGSGDKEEEKAQKKLAALEAEEKKMSKQAAAAKELQKDKERDVSGTKKNIDRLSKEYKAAEKRLKAVKASVSAYLEKSILVDDDSENSANEIDDFERGSKKEEESLKEAVDRVKEIEEKSGSKHIQKIEKTVKGKEKEVEALTKELDALHAQGAARARLDGALDELSKFEKRTKQAEKALSKEFASVSSLESKLLSSDANNDDKNDESKDSEDEETEDLEGAVGLVSKIRTFADKIEKQKDNASKQVKRVDALASKCEQILAGAKVRFDESFTKIDQTKSTLKGDLGHLVKNVGDEMSDLESKLNALIASTERKIAAKQMSKASKVEAAKLYEGFYDSAEASHLCPLCSRKFDNDDELQELLSKLNDEIDMNKEDEGDQVVQSKKKSKKGSSSVDSTKTEDQEARAILAHLSDLRSKLNEAKLIEATELPKREKAMNTAKENLDNAKGKAKKKKEIEENIINIDTKIRALLIPAQDLQQLIDSSEEAKLSVEKLKKESDQSGRGLSEVKELLDTGREELKRLIQEREDMRTALHVAREAKDKAAAICDARQATLKAYTVKKEMDELKKMLVKLEKEKDSAAKKARVADSDAVAAAQAAADERESAEQRVTARQQRVVSLQKKIAEFEQVSKQCSSVGSSLSDLNQKLEEAEEELNDVTQKLQERQDKLKALSSSVNESRQRLAEREVEKRNVEDNLAWRALKQEGEEMQSAVDRLNEELKNIAPDLPMNAKNQLKKEEERIEAIRDQLGISKGKQLSLRDHGKEAKRSLGKDSLKGIEVSHKKQMIELSATELGLTDLDRYYKALDMALMRFHASKMAEINKILEELWRVTYRGHDIDNIAIRSSEENANKKAAASTAATVKRQYDYRLVMIKNGVEIDMRGRCSAGQKVLASLVMRLALAETFCLGCGILALDEPTTNLDRYNIESLANALVRLIRARATQRHFQLIVISHDEDFCQILAKAQHADYYHSIYKNANGNSTVDTRDIGLLC